MTPNETANTLASSAEPSTTDTVLVIGAAGQLGTELVPELIRLYGTNNVVAADLSAPNFACHNLALDVTQPAQLTEALALFRVTIVYHLAALLSAKGEQQPDLAWRVNMEGLRHVLEACRLAGIRRLFWPSTIAVFGPNTPRHHTPQHTVMNPTTLYGVTKLAGEQLCAWYHRRYGLDVRSLRYPGLISYSAPPGGGTTDYAVEIFHHALAHDQYTCFLEPDAALPMLYMPDAVRATLELMQAPADAIRVRTSYNLGGLSFTPAQLADAIGQHRPKFQINYAPDFRQQIAQSWPASLDDTEARTDWGWKPNFDLDALTRDMLTQLAARQPLVVA